MHSHLYLDRYIQLSILVDAFSAAYNHVMTDASNSNC